MCRPLPHFAVPIKDADVAIEKNCGVSRPKAMIHLQGIKIPTIDNAIK